jgi:hemolysin III
MEHEIQAFILRQPVSAATHLFWSLWGVYAAALLWRLSRGDRLRQLALGCFGLSLVLLYAASGAYHAVPASAPQAIAWLKRLDRSLIYVLIAGTYTPVFTVLLTGRLRVMLLVTAWTLAAAGIISTWLLPVPPYAVTVGLYIGMGWLGLLPIVPLVRAIGVCGMALAIAGGLCYTLGALCDAVRWPVPLPGVVGSHEVFHLLVMAGTLAHFWFILCHVVPFRPAMLRPKIGIAVAADV